MFQTGGGCRASNYIYLIRKALKKAGMEQISVISFNLAGMERHPGFKLNLKILHGMMYAVLYGDLLMNLANQVRPYENIVGDAERLVDKWTKKLGKELGSGQRISYSHVKENYRAITGEFSAIETTKRSAVKVGIVGEIFVKYSPLGNNDLEKFLIAQGAETVVPGLIDFAMFFIWNSIMEFQVYGKKAAIYPLVRLVYRILNKKREDISETLNNSGKFRGWTPFDRVIRMADGYISHCVKMGEGWLLTAEMLELGESGCRNIVCAQPFGCLPNHICGKGMMKPVKEAHPDINIVAIDYDAGVSRVNQENRLKLMLANAKK